MSLAGANRPIGDITTLLDLTNRDAEENNLYPLTTKTTWFSRDKDRRLMPTTPILQEIPFRGPAAFGQRFTFDVGALQAGDLLHGMAIQIRLAHWLDPATLLAIQGGSKTYWDPDKKVWQYANNLGAVAVASAELEVDGVTIETLDGDFIQIYNTLFPDLNAQFGVATDSVGLRPIRDMTAQGQSYPYPTEDGIIHIFLPFFFGRIKFSEALPLLSIKEGTVRVNIALRPLSEVVRQIRGYRESCDSTPLGQTHNLIPPAVLQTPLVVVPGYPNALIVSPTTVKSVNVGLTPTYSGRFASIYAIDGPFELTYISDNPRLIRAIGVTTDPTTDRENYEIYVYYLFERDSPITTVVASRNTILYQDFGQRARTIVTIKYDGTTFSVYQNYFLIATHTATSIGPLYLTGILETYIDTPGVTISNISFTGERLVYPQEQSVTSLTTLPDFPHIALLTWGTLITGVLRDTMLHAPYEFLYRELQTFLFDEPMTYQIAKNSTSDTISVQLPIEANHPIEEIIWVVRRRSAADNNEWYNFGSYLERDFATRPALEQVPLLRTAQIQANGQTLIEGDERYFRREIATKHAGGIVAYNRFIYGYSFARSPGDHQPSGTINASRLNSLRLTLDVAVPTVFSYQDTTWEVRVYVLALNWLRVQNGLLNRMYQD
jgi:hypothetical protein